MKGIRFLLAAALLTVAPATAQDPKTSADPTKKPPKVKQALNKVFHGRIVKIKKKTVTLYYDFEDPDQLKDFEDARPPRLLDASQNKVSIRGGRLVLEGSSSIRHKMEGRGELRAKFFVRVGQQSNVGTVFTEPILGDFYVVLNLFDQRFYKNGMMLLAACGLHEDEGAEDLSSGLVNWRDITGWSVKDEVKVGQDAEIEVYKNGWEEFVGVNGRGRKGSSKGKVKEMKVYQFGFWVHHSRATFDDLLITFELTDEFLELNDLTASISADWEEIPESGPLAGIGGVPPRIRSQLDAYAAGGGVGKEVFEVMGRTGLEKKVRDIAADLLKQRRDAKLVPKLIDGLYAEDKYTRKLSIDVIKSIVGKTFGYSPGSSEKKRSASIQKLMAHVSQNRAKYYG